MTTTPHSPENRERIYQTLCLIVAGQLDRVSWPAFSLADWELLVATARAKGVAPLLYHTLGTGGWPEQMPATGELVDRIQVGYNSGGSMLVSTIASQRPAFDMIAPICLSWLPKSNIRYRVRTM